MSLAVVCIASLVALSVAVNGCETRSVLVRDEGARRVFGSESGEVIYCQDDRTGVIGLAGV